MAAYWASGTAGATGPCTLTMQLVCVLHPLPFHPLVVCAPHMHLSGAWEQDGNLVLHDGHGTPIWYTNTYGHPSINATLYVQYGAPAICVQAANPGGLCVFNSTIPPLYQAPNPAAIAGTLFTGQALPQVRCHRDPEHP